MGDLLTERKDECNQLRDFLENSEARSSPVSVEELLEAWPSAQRAHFAACRDCQEAVQDLLAAREIFRGVAAHAEEARPWFTTRVMAAIAARERELSEVTSTWLAVPKFASRLVLASAALLLVTSMWFYRTPSRAPAKQPSAAAAPEYLFEAPQPPMNQDDVLISMAEKNP